MKKDTLQMPSFYSATENGMVSLAQRIENRREK